MTPESRRNMMMTLAVLLVGGGMAYGLLVGKPGPAPAAAPETAPPLVDLVTVQPALHSLSVETQGTVQPLREIDLISQVAGRVISTADSFAAGGFFASGQPLVRIEEADYQFAIARAESRDLGSPEANDLFLRKPQLAAAEAALRAAEADLDAARLDLERTRVSVPFKGRISEKYVDVGQYVTRGTPIARVYATDVAQVRLPLTDRQVALLHLPLSYESGEDNSPAGAEVVLRARFANQTWEWRGRIVRTDASIDVDSRMVYAVAEVQQPFAREPDSERPPLAPGLFVSATISGRQIDGLVELPRDALRTDGSVLVVDNQQRAQSKPVAVLQSTPHRMWVSGLDRGDRVIVSDPSVAVAGMEVTVNDNAALAGRGN